MKKLKFITFIVAGAFLLPALSSCGGSGSDSSGNESDYYEGNESLGYTINPTSEMKVRSILANQTFRDNDGNSISFRGNHPMTVEFNGRMLANDVEVVDYGFTDDGGPYAIISVSGPYGHTSLYLTELDTDYGHLDSRVVIFDVNDKNNLYYKTR